MNRSFGQSRSNTSSFIFAGVVFLAFFSCNSKVEKKVKFAEKEIKKDTIVESLVAQLDIDRRGLAKLWFGDKDTLTVVSNFFTHKSIDSISTIEKTLVGNYLYCGKNTMNSNLLKYLKSKDPKGYSDLAGSKTGHTILVNRDTIYFSGKKGLPCFDRNTIIDAKITIYQIYIQEELLNFPSIKEISKSK